MDKLILASKSPRRSLLLRECGIDFETIVPNVREVLVAETPRRLVEQNALIKAQSVAESYPDRLVMGADTIVALGNAVFGKPKDENEALQMLKSLSGKTHSVFTAVAIVCKNKNIKKVFSRESKVSFKNLSEIEILAYIKAVYVLDKAGAYAAQEKGSMIIEKIDGDFDNVMGLPCKLVKEMLATIK
ncbi:MAG: Maf family protein [Opitutales bacterium]|nr:Maf family protein [Opitutales bacterium]